MLIKNSKGNVFTNIKDQMNRQGKYFEDILSGPALKRTPHMLYAQVKMGANCEEYLKLKPERLSNSQRMGKPLVKLVSQ